MSGATAPASMNQPTAGTDACVHSAQGPMTASSTVPMVMMLKVMAVVVEPVRMP